MQHSGHHCGRIELQLDQDLRYGQGMVHIGQTGKPVLAGVDLPGESTGLLQWYQLFRWQILAGLLY